MHVWRTYVELDIERIQLNMDSELYHSIYIDICLIYYRGKTCIHVVVTNNVSPNPFINIPEVEDLEKTKRGTGRTSTEP